MSATEDDTATQQQHAGLQDFFSYPFAQAIQDRRTRRVAQGTSLETGRSAVRVGQRALAALAA